MVESEATSDVAGLGGKVPQIFRQPIPGGFLGD
jgi:hypothetical protein